MYTKKSLSNTLGKSTTADQFLNIENFWTVSGWAKKSKDEILTLVIREGHVLGVSGVPQPGKLQGGEPVLNDAFHIGQVLAWLQDWLQVPGGPHVHDEGPAVGLDEADDGVGQALKSVKH